MENQKFKKILTEKELGSVITWAKEQPVPFKYFETIFNSLLQLPDLEENKKKEAK
tara:strand:- start:449 stop:613 length:165 start_codon:yes stop_codon:yes gene_type:complete